jgi:uncharacterized protein (UPF0335 family)
LVPSAPKITSPIFEATINKVFQMNRQLENLKAAVIDCALEIRRIRAEAVALNQVAAQTYKKAKYCGVQVKAAREVINALRGESATDDEIWTRYKAKVIDENAAPDHLSALDKILGPQIQ